MGRPVFALAVSLGAAILGPIPVAALPVAASPVAASDHHTPAVPAGRLAAGSERGGPTLTVISQSPWVGPGQPMQLRLGVGSAPPAGLSLNLALYQHLTSRSAFDETLGGTSVGEQLASVTVGVSSLPADPQGGVDVTIPVDSGDAAATGSGPLTAELRCAPGNCGGVYPLRLELFPTSGGPRTELFTYLVYVHPPPGTQKLRLAWVLPLSLAPGTQTSGPDTSASSLDTFGQLLASVSAHPAVPLTLAPNGATVSALESSSRQRARSALGTLQALSQDPDHQTLASPYVPVDPESLLSAGLGDELALQVHRGDSVLSAMHPGEGIWLAGSSLDQTSLSTLGTLGFDRLVVPPGDVSQGSAPTLTPTSPFELTAGHGVGASAVEADPGLAGDLSSGPVVGDALAAYRALADLALVYYEEPNDPTPRGVSVMATPSSQPDTKVVDTVLAQLGDDPLVAPVTLDGLFSGVPAASTSRRLPESSSAASLPTRQLKAARARLSAFSSAVGGDGAPVVHALDDQLLWSEDDELRPSVQQHWIAAFDRALDAQLASISIRADTIKLTSTAARVPITLLKQSGYGLTGTLRVSGDKVVFPADGAQSPGPVCHSTAEAVSAERSSFTCVATIGHPTNAVYLDMRARATGDFRLAVTFTSPSGGLVLASTHVTVRSMSTSLVAVALSAAAVVVLLVWWGRTVWRRHPAGHGAHARPRSAGRASK